jgi:hypothetical protein
MAANRDDFPQSVRGALADSVGGLCSRPDCRIFTKGPRTARLGAVSIGRAAHIHAASPGGPRYDPQQKPEERKSFANGVWLCANHAAEIDADDARFSAELLRTWKAEAETYAQALLGQQLVSVVRDAAPRGILAIGPDVLAIGQVIRTAGRNWTARIDSFLIGDVTDLRRFSDAFAELQPADCFVCAEAEGIGRLLVEAPTIDLADGIRLELKVAAPLPKHQAQERFDATKQVESMSLDLSGDAPDLVIGGGEVRGLDVIPQRLTIGLGTSRHHARILSGVFSRVGELVDRLGVEHATSIIAIETIRLATIPQHDDWLDRSFVAFDFVERVRGVRLLPTTTPDFLKAAISLDVYGTEGPREYVALIGTDHTPPPPSPSSFVPRL